MPIIPMLISFIVSFVMQVVGYIMVGQPKTEKSDKVRDLELPTAEAGRPIPVVFGEVEVVGLNCLWYGEKSTQTFDKET